MQTYLHVQARGAYTVAVKDAKKFFLKFVGANVAASEQDIIRNFRTAQIRINYNETETTVELKFVDSGIPYNPLTQDDPDIKQRIEERTVGGLGIFMVKKMMDSIEYHREDNKNILILKKKIA